MTNHIKILGAVLKDMLKNGEHKNYAKEDVDRAKENAILMEKENEAIDEAKKRVEDETKAYVESRKSGLSVKIKKASTERRKIVRGLYGLAVSAETDDNAEIVESGTAIVNAITTLRNENSGQKTDETGRIDSLVEKLTSDHAADLANIGAEKIMNKLKAKNDQIYKWNLELAKWKADIKGRLQISRKNTDEALEKLRMRIIGHIIFEGGEEYKDTVKHLNSLNKRTAAENAAGRRKKSSKKETNGEAKQNEAKHNNGKQHKADTTSKEETPNGKTVLQPEKEPVNTDTPTKEGEKTSPTGQETTVPTGNDSDTAKDNNGKSPDDNPKELTPAL